MSIYGLLASAWANDFKLIGTLEEMEKCWMDDIIWPINSHWPYTLSEIKEKTNILRAVTEESILSDWDKDESKKESGNFY